MRTEMKDDAVSPVIGTILMVAITVVLAAVLWLMVAGIIGPGSNNQSTNLNLAAPNVMTADPPRVGYDVVININKVSPNDQKVTWTELTIVIKSDSGSVPPGLPIDQHPQADDTAGYTNAVLYWFVDTSGNGNVDAGDSIKITGLTSDFQGASIDLLVGQEKIGSSTLPTSFP